MRNLSDLRKVEEMKSGMKSGVSTLFATACALAIGCSGGSKSTTPAAPVTYTIGGTVSGLTGAGLVLANSGGNSLTVSANATAFSFNNSLPVNEIYSVTVATQPAGESCAVANGNGKATANVTSIAVTCTTLDTIGGAITGLVNPGLVLQDNGSDSLTVAADASSFSFPTPLLDGGGYVVTVLTQPLGEVCLVGNGSGTAAAAVNNVAVTCTPQYEISGTVTGLNGAGLILQDNGGDALTLSAHAASFTFPTSVAAGGAYNITVLTQPSSENCSIIAGSGTATDSVSTARVVCVGDWTWTAGSSTLGLNGGQPGIYGTLGTPAAANLPGGRSQASDLDRCLGRYLALWRQRERREWNWRAAQRSCGSSILPPAQAASGPGSMVAPSTFPSISASFPPGAPGSLWHIGKTPRPQTFQEAVSNAPPGRMLSG